MPASAAVYLPPRSRRATPSGVSPATWNRSCPDVPSRVPPSLGPAPSVTKLRSAADPSAAYAAYPSVGFAAPMLGLVAARAKCIDMRLAADPSISSLQPGSLFLGCQGGSQPFCCLLRVVTVRTFPSPSAAWSFHHSRGESHLLFPSSWCLPPGSTPGDAERYYASFFPPSVPGESPRLTEVRTLVIAPETTSPSSPARHPHLPAAPPTPHGRLGLGLPPLRRQPLPRVPETREACLGAHRRCPHVPSRPRPPSAPAPPQCPSAGLPPHLPLTAAAVEAVGRYGAVDSAMLEQIVAEARYRARSRGALTATALDISSAAARFGGLPDPSSSPAEALPEHYDEVVDALEALRTSALSLQGGEGAPGPRPLVLVVGERSGVVAQMFRRAGADVATCDLRPSDCPEVPHFQGDASRIMDLGWDLVVGHPPCTYLSNAGVCHLYTDPQRWEHVLSNADVFRRIYAARAPFVAVENSKMHRYARRLVGVEPTQYVHPWQHGTGHTKPTGLYLRNLPPLRPTCEVKGREHALARLPPSPSRSDRRSRTYLGIAAAMALQWAPILYEHVSTLTGKRSTAADLVAGACRVTHGHGRVIFTRRASESHPDHDTVVDDDGELPLIPTPILGADAPSPATSVAAWAAHDVLLPHCWKAALGEALKYHPSGHLTSLSTTPSGEAPSLVHTWVVDVSRLDSDAMPQSKKPTASPLRWASSSAAATAAIHEVLPRLAAHAFDGSTDFALERLPDSRRPAPGKKASTHQANTLASPAAAVAKGDVPLSRFPWMYDHPDSAPPAPPTRHVRHIRGRWRAWTTVDPDANHSHAVFGWRPLPADLSSRLTAALRCSATLSTVPESTPASDPRESDIAAAAGPVAGRSSPMLSNLRRLWDRPAPPPGQRLGLGASTATPPREDIRKLSVRARAEHYRQSHRTFLPTGLVAPVAAATLPTAAHTTILQSAWEGRWDIANPAPPEPHTAAAAALAADDVALTPHSTGDLWGALYLTDIRLVRQPGTRRKQAPPVEVSCAVVRSLADTGAAPSLATTEFLAEAPADAVVGREPYATVPPLVDAAGRPLHTEGTVDLLFTLDGTTCRHTFTVVVGKPLLLFGNDFFGPRRAVIHMNEDGHGAGHITLTSTTVHGRPLQHTARVSSLPRHRPAAAAVDASVALATPADAQTNTAASPMTDAGPSPALPSLPEPTVEPGASGPVSGPPASVPLPASEVARDALEEGAWKLQTSEHLLYSARPIPLPPRSTTTVQVRAPRDLADRHPTCFVDRLPPRDGLDHVPLVTPGPVRIDETGFITVSITNLSRRRVTLPASSPLALLDSEYHVRGTVDPGTPSDSTEDPYSALSKEEKALVDSVTVDPDGRLTDEQTGRVRQLLARHVTAFATDPKNPAKTHLLEVELPLVPGAQPHRHGVSRLGEAGREIVEKHIDEMESRGIIRKSNSAWGSRVVLVTKKDGSIRFCVDFRDLNSKLQTLDSPIPHSADAIDRLSSGQGPQSSLFLSTLDLAAGFWTLPIKEEDKHLTAFVTHRSKYEFNYLPFGVQSGPSYMCRLMDAALQGLAWETCMPYLDDVGVWSTGSGATAEAREASSFEQMLSRLDAVFERLKWAGLSMKASKCTLFATSAEYLGHIISRDGLRMDPKKLATVAAIDPASINTVERVRSFLGLCSYYRRFISGFSKIASCLHNLTKDGVDVAARSQEDDCQTAIRTLITALTSEPVLATPRFDRPFIVKTDAANTEGLGGVLSQLDDEGRERAVAYHGRKLNKHERHYSVSEIELLAALECIKAWRPYLWGRRFKLVIDHSALRWLHTMRDTMEGGPASRLMRWILRLSEYDFVVEHKPGLLHKDADGVSRLAAAATRAAVPTARRLRAAQRQATDRAAITAEYLSPGAPSLDILRDEQLADPLCISIRRYLADGHAGDVLDSGALRRAAWLAREVCPRSGNRLIFDRDGVLHRRIIRPSDASTGYSEADVPIAPASLHHALITAFHDRAGHGSTNRTLGLLRARYYWPDMSRQVHEHVMECHECTLAANTSSRPRQPTGPTLGHYPFDVLYADIVDMARTHDYDAATGAGASKLVVFVDSLSRWVEAIPVHRSPTSSQILDIFSEHVLSRHGAPRRIVTDSGSNLASRLCDTILQKTGVNLAPSAAEHHEAVGVVERVQQTLVGMTRAANEGGGHWVDHLPFLLLSYRATPHRVTKLSPAMILYGRELRLPAQLSNAEEYCPPAAPPDAGAIEAYATRLHRQLVYAWRAARAHTRASQGETVADTVRRAAPPPQYSVNDLVVRRLPGHANKLDYVYAGPYRVRDVLGNGRYRLADLENNLTVDEFDTSNLRPYRTHIDADALQPDEYLVDELLKHRSRQGHREYLVKWRGYARRAATWVARSELERRCAELVTAYDSAHRASAPPRTADPPAAEAPAPAIDPAAAPGHLPHSARFERGRWLYARHVTTPRGLQTRWLPSSNFTPDELASEAFSRLRTQAAAASLLADNDPFVAVTVAAALLPATLPPLDPDAHHAAKVWFARQHRSQPQLLTFVRADARPERPQLDTFGGKLEPHDDTQYHRCALREVREEFTLPTVWKEPLGLQLAAYPTGQRLVRLRRASDDTTHHVAVWLISLPSDVSQHATRLTANGALEAAPHTLRWRPADDVLANLSEFAFLAPLREALIDLIADRDA